METQPKYLIVSLPYPIERKRQGVVTVAVISHDSIDRLTYHADQSAAAAWISEMENTIFNFDDELDDEEEETAA